MDKITIEQRKQIMKSIRSKDTKIEIKFRRELFKRGMRYKKNCQNYFGKPDLIFTHKKIVIFLDSCFWHGCPIHFKKPKSNIEYWDKKINSNILRDQEINIYYGKLNWAVLRYWEHEIENNFEQIIQEAVDIINSRIH